LGEGSEPEEEVDLAMGCDVSEWWWFPGAEFASDMLGKTVVPDEAGEFTLACRREGATTEPSLAEDDDVVLKCSSGLFTF
jgi:hypothetical protein